MNSSFLHSDDLDVLEKLAGDICVASRRAQRCLRHCKDPAISRIFEVSDLLLSTIGKTLAGNLEISAVTLPLHVPADLYQRLDVVSRSVQIHSANCSSLGHGGHFAQKSTELTRGSKADNLYKYEKWIHRKACSAKHSWMSDQAQGSSKPSFLSLDALLPVDGSDSDTTCPADSEDDAKTRSTSPKPGVTASEVLTQSELSARSGSIFVKPFAAAGCSSSQFSCKRECRWMDDPMRLIFADKLEDKFIRSKGTRVSNGCEAQIVRRQKGCRPYSFLFATCKNYNAGA